MSQTALVEWQYDQKEFDIYRRHFAPPTTTDDEWEIFLEMCRSYRISPIRRQIYLVGRYDSVKKRTVNVPQVSIGTLRLMAIRTNEFEGTTEPEWGDEEGNWYTCWPKAKGKHPYCARLGVYRKNFRTPAWGIVYFQEVAQWTDIWENGRKTDKKRLTSFWEDKAIHQIIKCAEADALRKAFEEECGGVYIHEEMAQADSDSPVVTIIPDVDAEANEALRETANARVMTRPDAATDQQIKSICNLSKLLDKPEPENMADMSSADAKKLIQQLSAEFQEKKKNSSPTPAPQKAEQSPVQDKALIKMIQTAKERCSAIGFVWDDLKDDALKMRIDDAYLTPKYVGQINALIKEHESKMSPLAS